jgi:hypothetical protein
MILILFGLFLTSPEVLHVHAGGPGLYNTECPFAEVATRHGDSSLPSSAAIVATWWTVGPTPAASVDHARSRCARYTDPRAPPLG